MRLTIPSPVLPDRDLDVDADIGLPAGALRRRLALLTGDARWAAPGTHLRAAGHPLDDDHPVGAPPLLPGAHLTPGPGVAHDGCAASDVDAASVAGAHAAVLGGPDTGRLHALPDGHRCVVPLAAGTGEPPGRAPVRVEIRRDGARARVRVMGAAGSLRPPAGRGTGARSHRRARRVGRVPRRWPAHLDLHVGTTTLRLRGTPWDEPGRDGRGDGVPPWVWAAAVPAVAAVGLAVVLRQPVLLLTAVTGVLALVGLRGARGPRAAVAPAPRAPGGDEPSPRDVAALRMATALRQRDRAGPVPGDDAPWPADRTLALTGVRGPSLGAARALVLRTLGAGSTTRLVLCGAAADDWRWTRWWDPTDRLPGPEVDDVLVVADGTQDALGAWRLASPRARLLLVTPAGAPPPAWAGTVLRADTLERVTARTAEDQARAAAALTALLPAARTARHGERPPVLGEMPDVPAPDARDVAATWSRERHPRSLVAPAGVGGAGRPLVLDLVRDGPHALVAGTTGAGKSELLTTLVLGLAVTHPPRRLAVLLVDFKGGTGLGPLAGLPHVVDHVHDLDVAAARRTLVGLRAELRRRERVLAAAGRTDLADLDPAQAATPARLLVVVDELRALVDDLPDAAATLARLAAQGRALGIHLLLATQRPAGAVPADLRANVGLRIALRVADEQDSRDVLGCGDAAHLDPGRPGAALVRVGSLPVTSLQVARARRRNPTPAVRLAPAGTAGPSDRWRAVRPPDDDVVAWVAACREAAAGLPGTGVPWLAALPTRMTAADAGDPVVAGELLVAVADRPEEQRRTPVTWTPGHGPLLVLGGPRSGRSTALLTVGTHAVRDGAHVHAVGLPEPAVRALRLVDPTRLGTLLAVDDVHRVLLLLDRLSHGREPDATTVLLVDGLDAALDALAAHARGRGLDLLTALLRHPPPGLRVAAAGGVVPALTRHLGTFGLRLVLPSADVTLDAQAGVPSELAGGRAVPGRAVACAPQGAVLCQVVLPAPGSGGADPAPGGCGPLRIGALPDRSLAPRDPAADGLRLGVGGDAPGPVAVDPVRPLVVAGPPGAGRTTALVTLAHAWARAGRDVVLVASAAHAPPAARRGPRPGMLAVRPADATALLDARDAAPAGGTDARTVVLVDDVDLLERTSPALVDRVDRLLAGAGGVRVVALATTTEHAASGLRGPVAAALRSRQVLVLDAHGPAASDLLGPAGTLHVDPRARPPGRGVLRLDRTLVRVQVDDAPHAAATVTSGARVLRTSPPRPAG